MFVGSDWKGTPQWNKYEEQFAGKDVEIVYLPHTDGISSTLLTGVIKNILDEQPEKSRGRLTKKYFAYLKCYSPKAVVNFKEAA